MIRKLKATAATFGIIATLVALLELSIKAACYFFLFLFTL